jgi:outer membrane protein TolC
MNLRNIIIGIISSFLISESAYADNSLITLYNSFVEGLPSVQSFSLKSQALNFENQGINRSRFLNPVLTTLYSNYQTQESGQFSIADLSLSNNIDIFNKIGVDMKKNKLEIERNKFLVKAERKEIYTNVLDAYSTLVKNKYLLETNKKDLEILDRHIEIVKTGVKNGTFPPTELSNWGIIRLNHINEIENYKLDIFKSELTLKLHSGLEQILTDDIDSTKIRAEKYPEISEESFIKKSPEIEALNVLQKQMELDIKKEKMDPLPTLQISDTLEYSEDPSANGNFNVILAAMNFQLPNGTAKHNIKSIQSKIKGIEQDKQTEVLLLKNIFRSKMQEMETQKAILINLENARTLSESKFDNVLKEYKKKSVSYATLFDAIEEQELIKERFRNKFCVNLNLRD